MVSESPTLYQMIENAIAGDPESIQHVMGYLNSSNPDLRHMMQSALHSASSEGLWQRLLYCIGHNCWPELDETGELSTPPELPKSAAHRGEPTSQVRQRFMVSRSMQSLVEIYIVDSSPDPECEFEVKQGVLLPALGDPDLLNRWAAGYLLGLRGNLRSVPILDEILGNPCSPTPDLSRDQCIRWQWRAVQALAALDDVTCGPPLVKALASPERSIHQAAAQAITEMGIRAEPALLHALHHPDPHVRWHAARALGQIGDLRAVDVLADGLVDDNYEVRWTTARVLANLDCAAIPAILKVLSTQPITEPLRQSAHHALNSMPSVHHPEIYGYLKPLLDTLHEASAFALIAVETPAIAQRLLLDWKNVSLICEPLPAYREDRRAY